MTSNWVERDKHINPMWKVLNKEVDLGGPTSFLDHVYLGCTQRQCEIRKDIVDNYRAMFVSAGKICVFLRGLTIWKNMPRNVLKYIVSWQTRRLNNSTKYQFHALMTIISKRKKWNLWENFEKVCSQIVCHKFLSILWSIVHVYSLTREHRVFQ